MTRLLVLTFLCTTCGCDKLEDTYQAHPDLLEPGQAAAASWCSASDGAYCPIVTKADVGVPLTYSSLPEGRCAVFLGDLDGIRVDPDAASDPTCVADPTDRDLSFQTLIAHELGHAAGLWHAYGCDDLMSDCPDRPAYPTERDIVALESVLGNGDSS